MRNRLLRPGLLASAIVAAVALAWVATPGSAPPISVALVSSWASSSPISGHRCTGVLIAPDQVATATHCLDGTQLSLVVARSICDRLPTGSPMVVGPISAPNAGSADLSVVHLDKAVQAAPPAVGPPTTGSASVVGFGDDPTTGRIGCTERRFGGAFAPCGADTSGDWCLDAPADVQLCGGSSGAPVFQVIDSTTTLVGVVSSGPPCGDQGPVRIAVFSSPRAQAATVMPVH